MNIRKNRLGRAAIVAVLIMMAGAAAGEVPRPDPERHGDQVAAIAARSTPAGEIIFTGSSSIRLWASLAEDFPGLPVHNHGFGGSVANDLVVHFDAILGRHQPRLVVLYTGANDLHETLTVEEAFADYRLLLEMIRRRIPEARVVVTSVKIAGVRSEQIPRVHQLNARLEAWAAERAWVRYVDCTSYLADGEGRPIPRYFSPDRLHLSDAGYEEWAKLLEPVVREEWRRVTEPAKR